ncbi:hypothetical protein A6R68_12112 [Neotoma lepida]|uniref:Uncharacterized protein n=1 Tax=Neotoma lepida TaxID=56216 RepID=A0A1A6H6T2_NEOLE|nr:hypothetical protein A6R68_12112 [Neotoma lepida]
MRTHPSRVPSTAGKPSDALTFPWPFQARQRAKRLRLWSSRHLVGVSLSSSGACPARAFSLLFSTPTTSWLVLAPGLVVRKGDRTAGAPLSHSLIMSKRTDS